MFDNPCGEIPLPPFTGFNYNLQFNTWRQPALAFGIVHDALRNAWARRPPQSAMVDAEAVEINDVAVNRLALAALKLSKISLRNPNDVSYWLRHRGVIGISDYMRTPNLSLSPLGSNMRRDFDAWQKEPAHKTYCDIRACKRALRVTVETLPTVLGPLHTVTKDDIVHIEMRWRIKDCAGKERRPLQGQRRAAFEAIWLAGEHARAYEYAGVKLPDLPPFSVWSEA